MAVFKGQHAVGRVAAGHSVEHLRPGGIRLRPYMLEQAGEGNVAERALHALIGHGPHAQHRALERAGQAHGVADEILVIFSVGLVRQPGAVFGHDGLLPGSVQNRQAPGLLVCGHPAHGVHTAAEQRRHLRVHRVDLSARLFQLVFLLLHGQHLPVASIFRAKSRQKRI